MAECADPPASSLKTADLVVNGALVETKLFIYGKVRFQSEMLWESMVLFIFIKSSLKVHTRCLLIEDHLVVSL